MRDRSVYEKKRNDERMSNIKNNMDAITVTEEEIRVSLEDLRLKMEIFSKHYFKDFEEGYKALFGDGLEPEKRKILIMSNAGKLEMDIDNANEAAFIKEFMNSTKEVINVKIGEFLFTIPAKADAEISFFKGCDSFEEIHSRYQKLMQIYHPDAETGDEATSKEINRQYEALKKEYKC